MKKFIILLIVTTLIVIFSFKSSAKADEINLVKNPSVEIGSSTPQNWQKNSWGKNSAKFVYAREGFDGSKSLYTEITLYTSGDAKWIFNQVNVSPNTSYSYSDYYKSNTTTYLVAQVKDTNGNITYLYLGSVAPSSTWNRVSVNVTTPENAKYLTIFHLISSVGFLQIDDIRLSNNLVPSVTPSVTPTPIPTSTPSPIPTSALTPTPSPSPTPSIVPITPTVTPSPISTVTVTITPAPSPTPSVSPTPSQVNNLISNASFEQIDNQGQPNDWYQDYWGVNTRNFSLLESEARTGSKSAKVTITSYKDGDAKWTFKHVLAKPNTSYIYSDYYKASVTTYYVAQAKSKSGNISYIYLGYSLPSSDWKKTEVSFITPSDVESFTIFHLISSVGFLTIDDAYLSEGMKDLGFERALVTLTFDDGTLSQYTNGAQLLAKYSFTGTFYLASGFLDSDPYFMSINQAHELLLLGHQIGSHTVSHEHLTTLTDDGLNYQLAQSQIDLNSWLLTNISDFCVPYGEYSGHVIDFISKYYRSSRTVNDGFNTKENFDIYQILVKNVILTTTTEEVKNWVNEAISRKAWLVLVYHQVDLGGRLL